MNKDYTNIYNNLIKLTRNKFLYVNLKSDETYSDRIIFLLLHLSFFLETTKKIILKMYFKKYMIYHCYTQNSARINTFELTSLNNKKCEF